MASLKTDNQDHGKPDSRLITVSNRLPVTITKDSKGLHFQDSVGGLATGLASLSATYQICWVGWPGISIDELSDSEKEQVVNKLADSRTCAVFLSKEQIEDFYEGFANKTIWPLFHYFPLNTVFEDRYWQSYQQVNEEFCRAVLDITGPDDCIWVHDYHLMLLPKLIRDKLPNAKIGFFLHIPFPSFEMFRLLPWRREILEGILGADLIGFHTYDYATHFLNSAARIAGVEHSMGTLTVGNRLVKVDAFPMGINYDKYSQAPHDSKVQQYASEIRKKVGDRKIIISIDRLDYTKGIIERLEVFELFLAQNPHYEGKVTLILLAVPSRAYVESYMQLRKRLERLIAKINGEHGTVGWMPIWYLYRAVPFEQLIALYTIADVAMVTPLRDGMNLIAKEFVAARVDGTGVLVLSEMAGASSELGEAVMVNAHDKHAVVQALADALELRQDEQIERNRSMQQRLSRYTVQRWAADFIEILNNVKGAQHKLSVNMLTEPGKQRLIERYRNSRRRLLLLDYDGTLVPFAGRPDKARPDDELITVLSKLAADNSNEIVVISGRDRHTLKNWLGGIGVSLVAEHGAWFCYPNQDWRMVEQFASEWKQVVRPVLQMFSDRTPGTFVEEKDFSLVWHYRRANQEMVEVRISELKNAISNLTKNLGVGVYEGNKVVEVKNAGISKGHVTELWLKSDEWDFILAAGDDFTDEDMFAVLPRAAYSIKMGLSISKAQFNLDGVRDFRLLLKRLSDVTVLPAFSEEAKC